MSTREDIAEHNDQTPESAHINSPSRRRLLKLGISGLGAVALSSLSLSALAASAESENGSSRDRNDATFASFMTLSTWLLSDKTLDEALGQRLFEAMERISVDNVPGMNRLPALKNKLLTLGETRDHLTNDDLEAPEMRLVRRLLQAWMLGTVGTAIDDPAAEVIAYEHAAMYAGPRDVQVVRTYCPNQPGFWAQRPA